MSEKKSSNNSRASQETHKEGQKHVYSTTESKGTPNHERPKPLKPKEQ